MPQCPYSNSPCIATRHRGCPRRLLGVVLSASLHFVCFGLSVCFFLYCCGLFHLTSCYLDTLRSFATAVLSSRSLRIFLCFFLFHAGRHLCWLAYVSLSLVVIEFGVAWMKNRLYWRCVSMSVLQVVTTEFAHLDGGNFTDSGCSGCRWAEVSVQCEDNTQSSGILSHEYPKKRVVMEGVRYRWKCAMVFVPSMWYPKNEQHYEDARYEEGRQGFEKAQSG